ncbi:MAG: class I SAM-dependent methyltransferase [Duncaniella sp.]|nr:class I SAM-dependent methyltransferase [Duncaniella sp.]
MDFNALRLKYHGDAAKMEEILQAECRHKCARKLERTLLHAGFRFPSTSLAEMATAEAVADLHARLATGAETALDMTLGLGIDALAMARTGMRVTGVELDSHAAEVARENARVLGLDNVDIINADSVAWLEASDRHFDLIFIDPARRDGAGRHFALRDCVPDVTAILPLMLSRASRVMIKCSPMLDISRLRAETSASADIIAAGTRRECKELLVILPGTGMTSAVTVDENGELTGTSGDKKAQPAFPAPGAFLLEPFPAVMKAGASLLLDDRFGDCRIAPSTHLYCSATVPGGFPGESFRIIEVHDFNKRSCSDIGRRYGMLNVATRNFPLTAPQLVKKLGVKEGGDFRLFGVTAADNRRILIITTNDPTDNIPGRTAGDTGC